MKGFEPQKRSDQKFCSSSCRSKEAFLRRHDYYKNYWLNVVPRFQWKTKTHCEVCGVEFQKTSPNQTQCSVQCTKKKWKLKNRRKVYDYQNLKAREKARLGWVDKKCNNCGKSFRPTLGKNNQQMFCSAKCRSEVNSLKSLSTGRKKINAHNYRANNVDKIKEKDEEYKSRIRFGAVSKTLNKRVVLDRDNKTCQLCQKPYQVIHHIRYSGKPEDLVCLCRACHASLHKRIKSEPYWD